MVRSRKEAENKSSSDRAVKGKLADEKFAKEWKPPTFTLKQIRDCVPAHCFKRDTLKSLSHVVVDAAMASALFYGALHIRYLDLQLQPMAWAAYWFAQGVVCTGLWVLAHECGHSAFSDYSIVNNSVGFILHTALLVPYFSWKYTHSKHHKGTNNLEKDQVFVPPSRRRVERHYKMPLSGSVDPLYSGESLFEDAPLYNVVQVVFMLLLGWPLYILKNVTSQKHKQWVSHFFPNAPIFDAREYYGVVYSNIGIAMMLGVLGSLIYKFGGLAVFAYYGIPYLFVNMWLVLITYLQHTDPTVPKYRGKEWDFMRGALGTVDRDFGILNYFFHHITDTHVVHHLFSTMPFYHAQEATAAVKEFLGPYYLFDSKPFYEAVFDCNATCKFVEDEGDIVWFKH
ncbi:Delta(12)-fatty-acid desaturase [Boothiomyces macroporosus]|uniref:Delta(12)-fatty-acid desaturase n=1 Tax=Boothiomyces macroporosus TaxID=261099 RepID=A0AAD5Y9V1_9FUNG|nr:Delta(12)-fatty-acid desaturase [Boothiomyces macroporosus]